MDILNYCIQGVAAASQTEPQQLKLFTFLIAHNVTPNHSFYFLVMMTEQLN